MKAYGLSRVNAGDNDVAGAIENGRATGLYNLPGKGGKIRAYRALRGGKKAKIRRHIKRLARVEGKKACEA